MSIMLKCSGQCRLVVGFEAKSMTIASPMLLSELLAEQSLAALLDGEGNFNQSVLVFINDKQCTNTDALMINDGDEVTFMSPMSGG